MSRWWRAYDDAINDPKLLRLSDEMHRAWFTLLCIASKHDGMLPPADDIALALRMKPAKVAEWITKLAGGGLLDNKDGVFVPHNWDGRQYKSDVSTDRVKRFRNGKRNVSCNVSETRYETKVETPPETETETHTEAEKKETRACALVVDDGWPADYREQFWSLYPNKVGKPKAIAKLEGVRKRAALVRFSEIMDGLQRYIASKPPDRAWLNPETFINQERWTDQPAQVENAKTGNIIQAANRLVDTVRLFDEGASRFDAIRSGEGAADVRMLSSR